MNTQSNLENTSTLQLQLLRIKNCFFRRFFLLTSNLCWFSTGVAQQYNPRRIYQHQLDQSSIRYPLMEVLRVMTRKGVTKIIMRSLIFQRRGRRSNSVKNDAFLYLENSSNFKLLVLPLVTCFCSYRNEPQDLRILLPLCAKKSPLFGNPCQVKYYCIKWKGESFSS